MTYAEIKGTVHCDFPQKLIDICFEYGISLVKSEVSTNEYYLENTEYTNIEASVLNNLREICYCIDLLLVDENYKYIHVTDKNTEVACNVFMSDIQRFLSVYKVINLDAVQEAIKLNDYNKKGFYTMSELYSVIHKIGNNNVTRAELSDILNKEHNNVTKVLCYIITKDVNKAEFQVYNDVNIECHYTIVKDGYLFIFGADEIYSLDDFINKYKNKYDTLILQYKQDGVIKSYVNGNNVDDIVFVG